MPKSSPSPKELDRTSHVAGEQGPGLVPLPTIVVQDESQADGMGGATAQSRVQRVAEAARQLTPLGFETFFFLTNRADDKNLELPKHAARGIKAALDELLSDRPVKVCIWEWHRESAKSTVAATLAAWLLGHFPDRTVCVFHANESAAQDIAGSIAERIDTPVYKLVFPHVEPDKIRGWGAGGYELKRTDIPYEVWMQEATTRITPNILGLGLYSAAIRGKRATLLLLGDDVTADDVVSEKELQEAGRRWDGAILPLRTEKGLALVVGTPQAYGDILDVTKKRGVGSNVFVPIFDENGDINWPEWWTRERADATKKAYGDVSWARNYLLDLKKASEIPLRYFTFPHDQIDLRWVAGGGVDYASQMAATSARPGRSHYAVAYILKRPSGGIVVYDGILGQFSQEDCEFYTAQAQTLFENYRGTVVEAIGKGEEHFNTMMRRPGLKLVPFKSHRKSKPDRLIMDLGPDLQRGSLLLSDAQTDFLNTARRFADQYPNVTTDDPGWDVWDAIYLARSLFLEAIVSGSKSDESEFSPSKKSIWSGLSQSHL